MIGYKSYYITLSSFKGLIIKALGKNIIQNIKPN